jgi:hypothetical protein
MRHFPASRVGYGIRGQWHASILTQLEQRPGFRRDLERRAPLQLGLPLML